MKSCSVKKVRVAVIGATGFTGEKLIDLLIKHPYADVTYISAKLQKNAKLSELFPKFKGKLNLVCKNLSLSEAASSAEVVFLALPHRVSFKIAPFFLKKGKIVIDLSADYRLKDSRVYEKFYSIVHGDKSNLKSAIYGLPEFYESEIKKTKLIANPGCYPTVSVLSLAPLLREKIIDNIIIDAKSGITGAGRNADLRYHFAHLNGDLFAYKPFDHQHLPEIKQILSEIASCKIELRFTPHVVSIERGILATIYANLKKNIKVSEINSIYDKYYSKKPFIRLFNQDLPQLKNVIGTNFCDIGFKLQGKDIVIVGAIDNLIKGASGQAIQNMNILLGFDQTLGLT